LCLLIGRCQDTSLPTRRDADGWGIGSCPPLSPRSEPPPSCGLLLVWCQGALPPRRKGRIPPLYLDTQLSDGLVKVVDVSQHPTDHEAMMSGESSFQCFPQSRDLRAKAAPSQLCQYLGIGGAANERICAGALPEAPSARVGQPKRALSQRLGAPSLGAEPLLCAPRSAPCGSG
jgi:hypothetical protein